VLFDIERIMACCQVQGLEAAIDTVLGPLPSRASPVKRPAALRTFRSARLRQGTQVTSEPLSQTSLEYLIQNMRPDLDPGPDPDFDPSKHPSAMPLLT
jgi:hypothetical protein